MFLAGLPLPEIQALVKPKFALDSRCRPWTGNSPSWQQAARLSIFGLMAIAAKPTKLRQTSAKSLEIFRTPRRPRKQSSPSQETGTVKASWREAKEATVLQAKARECVHQYLHDKGIQILKTGSISAEEIEEGSLIDAHYGSLAEKACMDPHDLVVPLDGQQRFEECFGISWDTALKEDLVCNAKEAQKRLGWTSRELGTNWDELKLGLGKVKFGGGFYCGKLEGIYVINGFYMAMRAKYVSPGSSVHWFYLRWQSSKLSWKTFREEIVGETDPATAAELHPGSIRGYFFNKWRELGLSAQPHVGDNVIHGSASPLEALTEKMTWLSCGFARDPFGQLLKDKGISNGDVKEWQQNPTVEMDGRKRPLFDHLENKDTSDCLSCLQTVQGLLLKKPVHMEVPVYKNLDLIRLLMATASTRRKCLS